MENIIGKSKFIIKNDGLITFLDRTRRIVLVRIKRKLLDNDHEFSRWLKLKNKYHGQRAFLIGNGPSLNKLPLFLLKNEYTIGFNRINLLYERLNWTPTFYTAIDDRVILDAINEIKKDLPKYQYVFLPDLHPYNINFKKIFMESENLYWLFLDNLEFSNNLPYAGINKSVANVGLQILAFLGFSPIYIIGVDLDYQNQTSVKRNTKRDLTSTKDDDPNHFDPRYFGEGRAYHQPQMEETFIRFREAKIFFDNLNVKIFNAGIGGNLEIFPRVDFSTLFNISEDKKEELFLESCGMEFNGKTLEEQLGKINHINNVQEWNDNYNIITMHQDIGLKMINKVIFTHIPRGPFNGKYYFFKRVE